MTPPKAVMKFELNEKVFVDHGPMFYEAKIIDVDPKDKDGRMYLVHYPGWNSRHDGWVAEALLMKFNEANIRKAKDLEVRQDDKNAPKKRKRPGLAGPKDVADRDSSRASTPSMEGKPKTGSTSESGGDSRRKKLRVDQYVESESQYASRPEIRVKMSDELKPILVDDWDYITRQYKLVQIPARVNVEQILSTYLDQRAGLLRGQKLSQLEECVKGIREYFNVMLGSQLLYKFERAQYADLLKDNPQKPASELYGAVHLLRLFVRLGHMLAYTRLSEKHTNQILGHIHDFMAFIVKQKSELFSFDDYMTASPEYQRNAFS